MNEKVNHSLTDVFLSDIYKIKDEQISSISITKAKFCLLDYLGVTIAGASLLKDKEAKLYTLLHDEQTEGIIIGTSRRNSLQNAIFLNGLNSHFLELDDGIRYGVIHPGAPLFSALIPIAASHSISWHSFLTGIIIGYETSIRIASSIQPYHYSAGYHPSATCCPLGVAVGLGVMMQLPLNVIKNAFSCAAISAGGSLKVLEDISELKIFNVGRAAKLAYLSIVMAQAGFLGPQEPLLGDTGFLKMMATHFDEKELHRPVKEEFYINKTYIKPYASCRHTHAAIEAAIRLRDLYSISLSEIESLQVITYSGVIGKHDGHEIYGEASAKMSIPYCVSIALATGRADMTVFEEPYISDKTILALTRIVEVVSDDYLSSLVPHKRAAIVRIKTKENIEYEEKVEYPKGEPENQMSQIELYAKFKSLINVAGVSEKRADEIISVIFDHEEINLKKLFNLLSE